MSQKATIAAFAVLAVSAVPASPQTPAWRQIGNTSLVAGLASPAGGRVDRLWFTPDGALYAALPSGLVFVSRNGESWQPSAAEAPPAPEFDATAPEPNAVVRAAGPAWYAAGKHLWRSTDRGRTWSNLTALGTRSILGGGIRDFAVDPANPERIAVAGETGVWISSDGGRSWSGLNEGLPALAVRRIVAAPAGSRGVRIAVEQEGRLEEYEWYPGQRMGWFPSADETVSREERLLRRWSEQLNARITAVSEAGGTIYLGDESGRLLASFDEGRTWRIAESAGAGAVLRIWTDPGDRNFALAALAQGGSDAPRLLRTLNGGAFWDDLTANLPRGDVYGVAADRQTGALYAATAAGLYFTFADLRAPAPATAWQPLGAGLPRGAVRDVRLDEAGNTLLAAVEGYGVFAAPAPHRRRAPRLVHSADLGERPAAPGALMTVIGARVSAASANAEPAPVLASDEAESQIQLPFELTGALVRVTVEAGQQRYSFGLPVASAAPAILVDRDGTPMVLDADSGAPIELMNPARGGMTLEILMSGLGRVTPSWPAGLPAPLENPPAVIAPVRAWLGGVELRVERATLAPGYTGFYVVRAELPALLDEGIHELVVEAGGIRSNPVRVYAVP